MKAPRKILFIKNSATGSFARSWVAEELGLHSRIIADAELLGRILSSEAFDLVILDQRGSNEELIPSIEGMRRFQPVSKLLVVSEGIALSEVQQAMRFNVHDIFLPPFDVIPVVERIDAIIAQLNGSTPTPAAKLLARWAEVGATLAGQLDAIFIQEDRNVTGETAEAVRTPEAQLLELQQRIERQDADLVTVRSQLAEATEARTRLNAEIAQLSAGASAMARAEARARSLEADLEEMRRTGGTGDADIGRLRDDLDRAHQRIRELEHLNSGLLAGVGAGDGGSGGGDFGGGGGGGDTSALEERIQALEAELADTNERFEAAGQAFAAEMEQIMAREADAMAALAAAEERESKAKAVMASAGDAFGRADEVLEKERELIQQQREELGLFRAALDAEREELTQLEQRVKSRSLAVDKLSQSFAEDLERVIAALGPLADRAQGLLARREEIAKLTGK